MRFLHSFSWRFETEHLSDWSASCNCGWRGYVFGVGAVEAEMYLRMKYVEHLQ